MAASSFILLSLSSSISSKLQLLASPFSSSSLANTVSFTSCTAFPAARKPPSLSLVITPKVAMASNVEQDEERRFSEDLKLFVGNLPFTVDSAKLAALFGRAGNVEMVEVIYDKESGRSRGFGFVTMSTVEEVEAAAQQFNGYALEGRPLRVSSGPPPRRDEFQSGGFRSGGNSGSANRVYVGNLSWDVDNEALETLFSEQGKVVEAKVIFDRESGRSKGFGFVTYNSAEEVDNAIESLNGVDLDGRNIRVTVAESRPRRQF